MGNLWKIFSSSVSATHRHSVFSRRWRRMNVCVWMRWKSMREGGVLDTITAARFSCLRILSFTGHRLRWISLHHSTLRWMNVCQVTFIEMHSSFPTYRLLCSHLFVFKVQPKYVNRNVDGLFCLWLGLKWVCLQNTCLWCNVYINDFAG